MTRDHRRVPAPQPRRRRDVERRVQPQPALMRGAVVAVLGLLASLGVGWAADVDKETVAAAAVLLSTLLPLAQAWWTRRAVTPATEVLAYVAADGAAVAGQAAAELTGEPLPVSYDGGAYVVTAPRTT